MRDKAVELLYQAEVAKHRLLRNEIDYDQAKEIVSKYVDYFNEVSVEKAKQFNRKPYTISVSGFMR